MSWRDEYQKGSFRGASFRTSDHERSGGRRVVTHEMPGRDEPVVEDLGRRMRQFSINCHAIGTDYRTQRDALIDALEAEGPGLLVHPWHGRMMVSVLEYTSTESTQDGGMVSFGITFGEAGQDAPAPVSVAEGASAETAADATIAAAPTAFTDDFSIADAASWVEESATDLIGAMADATQIAAGLRGGVGSTLRAFNIALNYLPGNVASLLRAPANLASAVIGLVSSVSVLGSSTGRSARLAPLLMMLDWEPDLSEFPETTPMRVIEATNTTALLRLYRTATAAELVRAASTLEYASYEEARATQDAITQRLDALSFAAADRGDDTAADVYDTLRRALADDIAARGVTLARVYSLDLMATLPALVLAHRLYRTDRRTATSLEDRAADITDRNSVQHPGFLPGGTTLQIVTAKDAS